MPEREPPSTESLRRWTQRPDATAIEAESLAPVLNNGLAVSSLLLGLAAMGPWLTGTSWSALLPGVPGSLALACALMARHVPRRRAWLVGTTGILGLLALGSAGALLGLGQAHQPGLRFQLACLGLCALHLLPAWPAWRRSAKEAQDAAAVQAMYDEL